MSYGNFKDPIGLLRRMLSSGNHAAYFTLLREGLALLFTPIDFLLRPFEKRKTRQASVSNLPIILIVGGSRSGTTLLYQVLAQYLPVSYFNNLSTSFPRSPITAGGIFNGLLKRKTGNFKNYFGNVSGFNGPNDGFHIWNRWLGPDRNVVPDEISAQQQKALVDFFYAWLSRFEKPFLNKNNRNSLCIPLFNSLFENIYFIAIRRNPVFVAQSLIQSREAVQGDKNIGWGLRSQDTKTEAHPLEYIDNVCAQVYEVDKLIERSLNGIDPEKYIYIEYEEFCARPSRSVQQIYQKIWGKTSDQIVAAELQPFVHTNLPKLADQEFERIVTSCEKLYGRTMTLSQESKPNGI